MLPKLILCVQLLSRPVVACEMGRLYNKEAVIELLLNTNRADTQYGPQAPHIEKLKDVVELDLVANPAYNSIRRDATGDGYYVDKLVSEWICPVTGLEMNGRFRFVVAFSTGKVVSERAIKVLQKDPNEAGRYRDEDLVLLNPAEEAIDEQTAMMVARRAKAKADRKAAKAAKKNIKQSEAVVTAFKMPAAPSTSSDQSLTDEPLLKKIRTDEDSTAGTSSKVSSKVFKDQGKGKKSKKTPEEASGSKKVFNPFAEQAKKEKDQDAIPKRDLNFVKRSVDLSAVKNASVQEGGKSEVFKKLFTSHKTAQNLPRGNWVTFDPRYN